MKALRTYSRILALVAAVLASTFSAKALDDVIITEFLAENDSVLPDENGDFEDWIELYNSGTNNVNLNGWYLTDAAGNLTKWRFPATNLNVNSYLVVFASNKDRRVAGRPLHTNFRLDNGGEFLALVKPDGVTIAFSVSPPGQVYPQQAADISYGVATVPSTTVLVSNGSTGKFTVPLNGDLGLSWIAEGFNDSSWVAVTNGVGFENNNTAVIGDATVVADSLADWSDTGVQGYNGWTYGAFVRSNSTVAYNASRFTAYPSGTGPHSTANFWDGAIWRWFDGEPPWDVIARDYTRPSIFPSGGTNAWEHQVIRRWTSEITGLITIEWRMAKKNPTGNGVTGRVYHNSASRDSMVLTGSQIAFTNRTIAAFSVQAGDTIDFVLEPGPDVVGDDTYFNATIRGASTLAGQFRTDVGNIMSNINASAYLRLPFNVADVTKIRGLTLRMRYDDGFIAYLNGTPIISRNFPDPTNWNSTASAQRADSDAVQVENIDLTQLPDILHNGPNVLAIHGLNASSTDGDFLIAAALEASLVTLNPSVRNYYRLPTPGAANGAGTTTLGALITEVTHVPHDPMDVDDLYVTARISQTFNPVTSVQLYYRVMFGSEVSVPMVDDGLHADGLPGDGIYGAVVPNTASTFGEMIRYYIVTRDAQGNSMREPSFPHPTLSAQYRGAVVQNPQLTNRLPVLHMFITQGALNTANSDNNTRNQFSLYYLGDFYDNIGISRHGQSSSGFPKKSYDIDFNPDKHFRYAPDTERVDDINLLTTYPDKARMRNMLSYGTYRDAGSPYHYVVPVRVQTNGGFYGDWHIVENGDGDFLKRIGRDPRGALYKMYNTFTTIANTTIGGDPNAEKKTRKEEGNADLVTLFTNISNGNLNIRTNYMYDNVNVSEVINATAARNLTADVDCCHKNYYFYRDSEGTGEWEAMPWDVDLSFGRNWQGADNPATPVGGDGCSCYWDTNMWYNNYVLVGGNNSFWQAIFNFAPTRQMYYRRLRTLMDEQLQPMGTPASDLHYEAFVNQFVSQIAPDGDLDLRKWGTWGSGIVGPIPTTDPQYQNTRQAADVIITNYLPNRRLALYNRTAGNSTEIPDSQPTNIVIRIGSLDYNPASANQQEEFIQLVNTNRLAVDISGWTLSGAVDHVFQGGVVMPSNSVLYVTPNKNAFRNRATAPRRGMGLYVEGPYKGQLSARGETVVLADKVGRIVSTNRYTGNPSAAQNSLRVTEIMYHPPNPPTGSPFEAEDFEYIEFRNIGATTLDLAGVKITNGVEFSFTGSAITSLAAGQYVLVVKNVAAFTSRYGSGLSVAGQFVGFLDNGGENIQIDDAVGEKVQDFTYNSSWYPITDGPGASLVIINDNAPWDSWGLKESWRPSFHDFGSPGQTDPAPVSVQPVVINEILTHTDLPSVDQIELFNGNSQSVDISGWFLSDDFATPKKFRVPNGTILAAGGYRTYTEADFNVASSSTAFSLSSNGDEVYLFSGDGTNITGYVQGYSFAAAANGVSFGRYINSQTNIHFVAQIANTFTAVNSGPRVGPVVISEINYRPVDLPGGVDNTIDEYIEVANITGDPVPLFDPANPNNTWRVRGGVDFDLPTGITLPAGGYLLVVNFNPTNTPLLNSFRDRFSVPGNVPVVGPYEGSLANTGEEIHISRPDTPDIEGAPYIVVDAIEYSNQLPWPASADGIGPSLQRKLQPAYGNDPTNWTGVGPSPGNPFVSGGSPPVITQQPQNTSGVVGKSATFAVTVTGTSPLFYQWRFNGTNMYGANNSMLVLNGLTSASAGLYSCIVFNSGGSAESNPGRLTVFYPPSITSNPADVKVRIRPDPQAAPTTNATFTVAATSSTPPIRYQWLFNGSVIPNATNSSYTVFDVKEANYGQFVCTVTDNIDTVPSQPATLYPMINPIIRVNPASHTNVPPGELLGLSVNYTGFPPPFTNEWRRGSLSVGTNVVLGTNDVFAVVVLPGTNTYRAVVKNVANPAPGAPSSFSTVISGVDTDGDGIPDSVESDLGLNPNDAADGALDADGDTMNNKDEYLAGTDPKNSASYLKVEQTTIPGTVTISVAAVANKTYSVQYTDALPAGQWSKLGDIIAKPTDRIEQLTDNQWTGSRFYRVVLPGQP